MTKHPDLRHERKLWQAGVQLVAGVDEVGVGPMAGPVMAAAVIFAPETFIKGVHDSKQLSPLQREAMFEAIQARALAIGVAEVSVEEIDRINIFHAAQAACRTAIARLATLPEHVLVDGRALRGLQVRQTAIVGGDRKSFCIAAASIIAKVQRDRLMCYYDQLYPGYGFARHKGYCTAEHLAAVKRLGPSPLHRTSFSPVMAAAQLRLQLQ
ncbi:MAG TPA: ribonuclease HII [Candidatus Binataceae bacterium]|nr:ribonuclease HII [Candidatus Binataceae bacterium]